MTENVTINTGTLPLFHVTVTEAVKDGTSLQFTIMATKVDGDRGLVVTRQFEDIEWLHHVLVSGNDTSGIIVSTTFLCRTLHGNTGEPLLKVHPHERLYACFRAIFL